MQYVVSSPRHRPGGTPVTSSPTRPGAPPQEMHMPTERRGKTYTVEDAIEAMGLGWFQAKIFVVGKMITAADAMEMMMLAVLSPLVRCEWALSDYQVAFITTAVFVGMGVASPLLGIVGDKYGRKVVLVIVTLCIGYFGFLTTFSPSFGWMLFLRGLVGVGMGGSPQGFSLNAEYVPSKYRAKLLIFGTVFWTLGSIFEILLAMLVVPSLGWRYLLAFSSLPVLATCVGLIWIPESARFLAAAGYLDDATTILEGAAKMNKSVLPDGRLVKSPEITLGRPRDLFSREYLRSTLQVWLLWFGVAFTYYGMVLASAEVLRVRNKDKTSHCNCVYLTTEDYTTMILSSLGELLSLPINFFLLDRIGRRWTGGLCYLGTSLFFILIQLDVGLNTLTTFMFFVRAFSSACFNFVYIYSSELYPTSIRTLGMGTASAWARVGAMLTPFVAQVLLSNSIQAATWVYGALCMLCGISCFLLPIETKGRALPQMVSYNSDTDTVDLGESLPGSSYVSEAEAEEPAHVATVSGKRGAEGKRGEEEEMFTDLGDGGR
ncbi:putative transporter SVOPL [Aplysia californica]|uniref:Transporter SVOPL n=1 Tax=Aplysia californica TaxID=6500 RepID=A0ABM0K4Y1_APLCA|nr:putative transporter SVOPL [Aplysia californica]